MSKVAKWRQFSENEIKDFIENSNNLKEAFQKMGYKNYCPKTFQNIITLYPNLKPEKENDNRKRVYRKNNNIPLIEIPYWDFEILNENYIKEKINEYCN